MRSGHFGKVVDLRDVPRNKMLVFEIQTNTTTMRKRNELLDQYPFRAAPHFHKYRLPIFERFVNLGLQVEKPDGGFFEAIVEVPTSIRIKTCVFPCYVWVTDKL
ncbi:hypothetical protein NKR23_g8640 [Pleurostoma richardsiae]|uniref:Uncharacterized protein n=1 Tax=Pleurostoma richardsiae TaxID=41990 RepID=A0AA38RI27_9PEZI|nr:hypothetical protein NKR23_g8640 [Pleurostoma richardsiae]